LEYWPNNKRRNRKIFLVFHQPKEDKKKKMWIKNIIIKKWGAIHWGVVK